MSDRLPLGVTAVMLAELDFDEQLSLCSELGITHYQFRPRIIPDDKRADPYSHWGNHKFDLTPKRLVEEGAALAQRVRAAGMQPFGTVPGASSASDDAELREHFEGAKACGAGRVRVNPRPYEREQPFDYDAYLAQLHDDYRRAVALAEPLGIKPVIEMHIGNAASAAGMARAIVEGVDPTGEKIGLLYDLPNACREGYIQPTLTLSAIGRWIDHVHTGGARVVEGERDEYGCRVRQSVFVPLRDADLNLPEWLRHLDALAGQLGRPIPLIIEDYTPGLSSEARLRDCVETINACLP